MWFLFCKLGYVEQDDALEHQRCKGETPGQDLSM